MSYNSSKGPINIGDLINEDDPDTLIDWESDKIVFKTNSTKRFVIDNNEISGSGAAVIVGNTVLGGTLKVSGSATLAGNTTLGNAASDVTTLTGQVTASAGVLLNGTLDVAGNTTLGNAASDVVTLTGQVTASAEITGTVGRFTELRVSNLVGGSPISISASHIAFTGSIDMGSTSTTSYISGSGEHASSATGSYTSGSEGYTVLSSTGSYTSGSDGGSTEISGGHIIITGSSPALTIHSGDLIVSGNTYLGDTASDVTSLIGQVTASAGVLLNSTLDVGGNTTLGNAASDVTTLTGQVTASAGVLLNSTLDVGGNTTLGNAAGDTLNITGRTTATGNVSASLGITGSLLLSTGSTAQVAVGVKSPVATNMLYVSTIDNDNRVPLLIVDTTEKILLAVSGSGKVVVGGKGAPYIDGLLNITGSESEKLITIKSDIKNPVFYVKGDGDTFVSGALMIQDTHPTLHFSSSAGTGLGAAGYNSSDNIVIQNNVVNKHIVFKTSDAGVLKEGFRIDGAVPEVVVNQSSDSLIDFRVESNGNTHMFFVDGSANKVGIDTNAPEVKLDINDNAIRIRNSSTPSSAGDFGVAGEIRWDANYIYVCTATDTWKRVAISTW